MKSSRAGWRTMLKLKLCSHGSSRSTWNPRCRRIMSTFWREGEGRGGEGGREGGEGRGGEGRGGEGRGGRPSTAVNSMPIFVSFIFLPVTIFFCPFLGTTKHL